MEAPVCARAFLIESLSNNKAFQFLLGGTLVFSFGIWLLFSWVAALAVISAYIIGILICLIFRDRIMLLTELVISSPIPVVPSAGQNIRQACLVCGNRRCGRHKPVVPTYHQTFLPEPVDQALEQLLEQILAKFIIRWHSRISEDMEFEQQLRISMQGAISSLLARATQLDETQVITDRLLPAAIAHLSTLLHHSKAFPSNHVEDKHRFPTEQESVPDRWPLDDNPYTSVPIHWHSAVLSRHHELSYLRNLIKHILPHVVPEYQLKCRAWGGLLKEIMARWVLLPAMDLLADGAIILRLLVHLLDNSHPQSIELLPYPMVPTLRGFVFNNSSQSTSRLRMGLRDVIRDRRLLYHFMQFLKKEGSVHVLQFVLDLEKFNDVILNPDLEDANCKELFQEAWDIFSLYFQPSSPDFVGFPSEIIQSMRKVLEVGEKNILTLRNTPPLFQASDWALTKLETELLPLFHHSDDFFIMLCGGRSSKVRKKHPPRTRGEDILGVTWSRGENSAAFSVIRDDTKLMSPEDCGPQITSHRNLNAWRVSVPRVYLRPDMPGSSRITTVMVISVQRIDIKEYDDPDECFWTVYRSHTDFCVLASKLQEFHGEFELAFGAPVKQPVTQGLDALEAWRIDGEEYLQLLLQTPSLQNSDLLCTFLSRDITDFADIIGGAEMSLGKLLSTVRIRKENGQHLEPFISNLLTASRKSRKKRKKRKQNKEEPTSSESILKLKKLNLHHDIFGDNLGQSNLPVDKLECNNTKSNEHPYSLQGFFDCFTYLVVHLFGAPIFIAHVILSIREFVRKFVNSYYQRKLKIELRHALRPQHLVQLINMLRESISERKYTPRSSEEIEMKNAIAVLHYIEGRIPWPASRLPNTHVSVAALISAICTPLLNKQLAYTLLDIIAEELVPELAVSKSDITPK